MKSFILLLLIPILASSGHAAKNDLDWLVGCWVTSDQSSQEVWVINGDNLLIGFSATVGAGQIVFYELLSIQRNDNDELIYTAHPSGQASASFTAVKSSENSVVFANYNNDYPQEISYRRDDRQLYATISLRGGDRPNSFTKAACD